MRCDELFSHIFKYQMRAFTFRQENLTVHDFAESLHENRIRNWIILRNSTNISKAHAAMPLCMICYGQIDNDNAIFVLQHTKTWVKFNGHIYSATKILIANIARRACRRERERKKRKTKNASFAFTSIANSDEDHFYCQIMRFRYDAGRSTICTKMKWNYK